jgi:hypothetical protein
MEVILGHTWMVDVDFQYINILIYSIVSVNITTEFTTLGISSFILIRLQSKICHDIKEFMPTL